MYINNADINKTSSIRFSPPRIITCGFAIMILTGAILLTLPIASRSGTSVGFINALFTATSANCVTGLVVVNTLEHWTVFGKIVILALIQLGGLGYMTVLTLTMMLFKQKIGLKTRVNIQASYNLDTVGGMVRLVKNIALITLLFESLGAFLLTFGFYLFPIAGAAPPSFLKALGMGAFHSVSAFCNAGFDIIGDNSLIPYRDNPYICGIIAALIVCGGLGFTIWSEIFDTVKNRKEHTLTSGIKRLSLHSKLAIIVTAALLLAGAALTLAVEWSNPKTLGPLSLPAKIHASLFQSVTLRTAGFDSINQMNLNDISKFIASILMIIGGSPASTAGGMKTVTVAVLVLTVISALRGKNQVEAFGRTISMRALQKSLTVALTMLIVVFFSSVALYFTENLSENNLSFMDLIFEICSAAGTVGLSVGLSPILSAPGKIIIIICMFLGRLSPVTVAVALNMKFNSTFSNATYPEENVIIG